MAKPKAVTNYQGGAVYTRARQQFQVLYEREGSFPRACALQDLILWPSQYDEKGDLRLPPPHILESWARDVDEGRADIPEKVRKAFISRYDSYLEACAREALVENAKTVKVLATLAREGTLAADRSSQYLHANNGLGFLVKELIGRKVTATPMQKRVRSVRVLAPKKELREGMIDAEFRALPSP